MPPASAPQPDQALVDTALVSLKTALVGANLTARGGQRTPLRRLTRLEYGYTIQDLLHLDEAVGAELATLLPAEADSGGFDTVAANQSMSPLHVRSYLEAADRALDAALVVGPPPAIQHHNIDYAKSPGLFGLSDCDFLACGAILKQDDGYATFSQVSATFMFHSMSEGFGVAYPGRYRVSVEAYQCGNQRPQASGGQRRTAQPHQSTKQQPQQNQQGSDGEPSIWSPTSDRCCRHNR